MSATVQFQTQLTYRQVAELARQLPAQDKRRLAKLLEKEVAQEQLVASFDESTLTQLQRETVANIRQGVKELKLMRDGKLQAQSSDDYLAELREEGYL